MLYVEYRYVACFRYKRGEMVVGETIFISEQFEGVITYVHHSGLKIVKCYGTNNVCSIMYGRINGLFL